MGVTALFACNAAHTGGGAPVGSGAEPEIVDYCRACGEPEATGRLGDVAIDEASGLAASRVHPDVYYLNNDSGDTPRFFAIDSRGTDLGSYRVRSAEAIDWEDAAAGPCEEGRAASCVYFADIGDNDRLRDSYTVYRVAEPKTIQPGTHEVAGDAIPFRYPDGSHDAETLLVHPESGQLYIVTKVSEGPSTIYRFPLPLVPNRETLLVRVGQLTPPAGIVRFTAGDVHPRARGVLLRSYSHLFFYPLEGDLGAALAAAPCVMPVLAELQGETVAWTLAGDGYITVSEGVGSELHRVTCR
jgi:hypothetical protein